jgi:hypothetical protein
MLHIETCMDEYKDLGWWLLRLKRSSYVNMTSDKLISFVY